MLIHITYRDYNHRVLHSNIQDFQKVKVIACATVIEEMLPLMPEGMAYEVLDFGLHRIPKNLKQSLQNCIDQSSSDYNILILGYGLCSMAVVGLQSQNSTLVIPRVDDCIAIFLGSSEAYQEQSRKELGTYYLTKGWIVVGDTLLGERTRLTEKFGAEKAEFILYEMLKHYKRVAYIDTGTDQQEQYRSYAKIVAEELKLRFEAIHGSNRLVQKMLFGPWDSDFVVAPPGNAITYQDFKEI